MSKTVLVVEDDKLVRHGLVENLKAENLTVHEAANGKAGLDMALTVKPDLIVTDIRMPEMDGLTMVGHLRDDIWGKDVPIIILSTDETTTAVNAALKEGVTFYLPKTTLGPDAITKQILTTLG